MYLESNELFLGLGGIIIRVFREGESGHMCEESEEEGEGNVSHDLLTLRSL